MKQPSLHPMLVADAGNSSVKFAVVTRPGRHPRLAARIANEDLTASRVRSLVRTSGARTVTAASVVPAIARVLAEASPHIALIGPDTPLNFRCLTDRRVTGADRLANMAAAASRHGGGVIVADFGTAATFDALDAGGSFVGGAIAPGLRAMGRALASGTALLPDTAPAPPRRMAGRNTGEALRAGVVGGYSGLVRHILDALTGEVFGRRKPQLVFTGGDAAEVARLTGLTATVDPLWTLRGIAVLGEAALREASKQAGCRTDKR
jgi:type III pantothenate kinase